MTARRRKAGAGFRLRWFAGLIIGILAVSVLVPALSSAASPGGSPAQAQPSGTGPVTATVTWDGHNIGDYGTATSAATISFNGVANVLYTWTSSAPVTINDARLAIYYFGFALATRDVINSAAAPTTSGSFTMNWTTGSLQYILAGSYRLVASLLAPNGTSMWSQTFYVNVAPPYYILALLPIVLILLAIWELYNVATCGKQVYAGKRPPEAAKGGAEEEAVGGAPSAPPEEATAEGGPGTGEGTEPDASTGAPPSEGGST